MRKKNSPNSQNESIERRILVVDDNHDFAESMLDILESRGYVVEAAHDAKEAIKRIRDFDVHLAFIDIRLGHSNGLSLISAFKSLNTKILCVMMTAYADIDTSIQALQNGAYDYLQKPIDTPDLLATIDRCFEKIQLGAEKSAAEEELRESENKFRRLSQEFHTLLDAIDDPMIQISPELKILWANRSAEIFSGNDISSLKGKHCYKLWFNRSAPCDDCPAIEKCFKTGETGSIQFSTPDGRFCNIKAFPVKDENGKVNNVIEVYNDITKEMTLQEESIRASQLASVGELAASVAHEINNPIYGITMCAQSLLIESGDNKVKDSDIAKMILKEADRIVNVTRCLLSFVRDSGDSKSLCNIHEIISDTFTISGVLMRKEGIDIRIQIPEDLPEILAYPQRIQQVFLNLLNNARYTLDEKYPDTNENKIIEIIGKEIIVDGCPYNQIIFYDRGMGIASDKIEKILNPFFTTKPMGKGTGLGLSICNKIIKDHDGKIEIDSVEGEYTKFIISLPAATHKNQKTTKTKRQRKTNEQQQEH